MNLEFRREVENGDIDLGVFCKCMKLDEIRKRVDREEKKPSLSPEALQHEEVQNRSK